MSFKFGFNDDSDIELEDTIEESSSTTTNNNNHNNNKYDLSILNSSNNQFKLNSKLESLEDIVDSMRGERLTYECINNDDEINNLLGINNFKLYKRELFDIKQQLMTEDNDLVSGKQDSAGQDDDEFKILIGDIEEDLRKGVYEGGLKSWECSNDLIKYLQHYDQDQDIGKFNTIIDLGCGTSIPSIFIFIKLIKLNMIKDKTIILSDYNYNVLRLTTIPNLLINYYLNCLSTQELIILQKKFSDHTGNIRDFEIDLTDNLIDNFLQFLSTNNIKIKLISGNWNLNFLEIVKESVDESSKILCISSETIYSSDIIPIISILLVNILKLNSQFENRVLVGCKDYYFGVGGSVLEFTKILNDLKKEYDFEFDVMKINSNLKRSIVCLNNI
ncbi:hypothetical protein BVG19_g4836 [[Candida] boidinii]|nr:hypothetical protein BVG19_g4836 [[Candida] boidinii]OWB51267.1 hypothetical protein B5S27_g2827 [[Candida] boidinii]